MRNIGNHGLQCPEFDDYAAVALYMQNLGTLIDSELQAQLDLLQGFLDQPTIIVTNLAARVITSGASVQNLYDTVLFNNSTFFSLRTDTVNSRTVIDIGSPIGSPVTIPYLHGSYSAGLGMTETAATPTAFSFRSVAMDVVDESVLNNLFITDFIDTTYETNTGGDEAQNIKVNFELNRTSGIEVRHLFTNDNAAGNITITAGCLWWVTYNGPIDVIEVA